MLKTHTSLYQHAVQTLHALRVLRAHGMPDEALQVVFRSVVVGRLLYASCAWSGFVTANDRKRVDALLRRSKRGRFCSPDLASYDELLAEAYTGLFSRISTSSLHVLYDLLPPPSTASHHYIAFVNDHIISHYLTAPLTLPIPTSSPDASSTMLTNSLMINRL